MRVIKKDWERERLNKEKEREQFRKVEEEEEKQLVWISLSGYLWHQRNNSFVTQSFRITAKTTLTTTKINSKSTIVMSYQYFWGGEKMDPSRDR